MNKKIFFVLIALSLFFSIISPQTISANEPSTQPKTETVVKKTAEISPYFYVHKNKTITINYNNYYSVPQTYSYEEYDSGLGVWYTGNLALKSVKQSSTGIWIATFSGQISAWV